MKAIKCKVISNEQIEKKIYKMVFRSDYISTEARPGQFVHIKLCQHSGLLLRRPISIASVDLNRQSFTIYIQIKGQGTEILCSSVKGDYMDMIGPCGSYFNVSEDIKDIILIGGGIGIAPLLLAAQHFKDRNITSLLGYRDGGQVFSVYEFEKFSKQVLISTDDASVGYGGKITDVLIDILRSGKYDCVLGCGPYPMLKTVKDICQQNDILCQVSLEQNMGCGIGACMGCACKIKTDGGYTYKRVCKDGPVFYADEVIFDE